MANEPLTTPPQTPVEPDVTTEPVVEVEDVPTMTFDDLLQGVPPVVRGYILLPEFSNRHNKIFTSAKLTDDQASTLLELSIETFCGLVKPEDYFDQAFERLGWTTDRKAELQKIVADILGNAMLPARQYFGDLSPAMAALGADPTNYPSTEIEPRTVDFETVFSDVYAVIDPDGELYDQAKRVRIEAVAKEQINGLSREEALAKYSRGEKVGGAELPEEVATLVTLLVAQNMLYTKFVEPEAEVDEIAEYYKNPEDSLLPSQNQSQSQTQSSPQSTVTDEEIRELYNGSNEERQRITETVQRLSATQKGQEKAIAVALAGANVTRDPFDILSSLLFLAKNGVLMNVLKEDPRYSQAVVMELGKTSKPVTLEEVASAPENSKYIAAFLKYQLTNGAKFSENDAARFALRVSSLMKKHGWQGGDISAFDKEKNNFRFTDDV